MINKVLIFLVLTFNIVLTQGPSASFESDRYEVYAHSGESTITLKFEMGDLDSLWAFNIALYADTSVIKLMDAVWHIDFPFEYSQFTVVPVGDTLANGDINDRLQIGAMTTEEEIVYTGEGDKIFDISFEIVGDINDSTLIEFTKFQIADEYKQNTTPTNIILVGGVNCNNLAACNYNENSSSDIDCILIPEGECDCFGTLIDECGNCGGDGYALACVGTDACLNMDCAGDCEIDSSVSCEGANCGTAILDECGICDGGNYFLPCFGTDDCFVMDCAGECGGTALLTPCGDCSDVSNCNFSFEITTMDNNFRSNNIQVPISLLNFNYAGFSESSPGNAGGIEAMAFTVTFDPQLLEINSENSVALLNGLNYTFNENSPGEILVTLFDDSNVELYQSLDGPIVNLSFDVIEERYTRGLHGDGSEISIALTQLGPVDFDQENFGQENITDTGTLTIYTKACIDPFASTIDSNFICDVDVDVCDENGILEGSNIFNDGCILPEADFEDILEGEINNNITTDSTIVNVISADFPDFNYTLRIPQNTTIDFPIGGVASLDLRDSPVEIIYLPDVAPNAQLASSLVGLYPFGTNFDPPIEFIFTFSDLSRGTSEYKLLYMDDIQTGDWEEVGTCSDEVLGLCKVEDLESSGLFIVMYGENLSIDEFIIPSDFNLYRSYPNPFNPITTLEFDVANSGLVTFMVYNINGRIVDSISSKFYTPGNYQIKWEARDFPSGIYLIQMRTESSTYFQKVMLLK